MRLQIDGMRCASCAARVERGLNRVEGVSASLFVVGNSLRLQPLPRNPRAVPEEAVAALRGLGLVPVLLTGDTREQAAEKTRELLEAVQRFTRTR